MIRIEAVWMSTAPLDMRAGTDTALARVVAVFGAARPHHAYCFANRRANRMKVLVNDHPTMSLSSAQLDTLVLGLPWQRIGAAGVITVV
jgi:transposase